MSEIATRWLPALAERAQAEPLVLLHGWGSDSRSWQPLLPALNQHCDLLLVDLPGFADSSAPGLQLDHWLPELLARLPERAIYLGWSLGGMLATQIAARYPGRVSALITLAANLNFAASEHWPAAMAADTFAQFCEAFGQSPAPTLKRFAGLMAAGDVDERSRLKQLRSLGSDSFAAQRTEAWSAALALLGQLDNRHNFAELSQPGLHLFAEGDALVPASTVAAMSPLNRQQACELLADCCHALHWSQPEAVAERILLFLQRLQQQVDKRRVADSFSRAAPSYDSVAALQRQIGERLLSAAELREQPVARLLDLGSGTGYFTPQLSECCEQAFNLDLAEGMLHFARAQHPGLSLGVCGDAEQLPFADHSFDSLFSSLAIQWCANLPQLFSELRRVLKPGARLHIATLGPRTLCELRDAWLAVDTYTHVNDFAPRAQLESAIAQAGLSLVSLCEEDIVLSYQQVRELTYELKTLGAHNMNQGQSSGLTGRRHIKAFREAYEGFRRADGSLPATYEVFYLTLQASFLPLSPRGMTQLGRLTER